MDSPSPSTFLVFLPSRTIEPVQTWFETGSNPVSIGSSLRLIPNPRGADLPQHGGGIDISARDLDCWTVRDPGWFERETSDLVRPTEAAVRHTRHHGRTQGRTRPSADGARVQEVSELARKAELCAQVHLWTDGAGRRGGTGCLGEVWRRKDQKSVAIFPQDT